MKKLYLLLVLGIPLQSYAQPTLTNALNYSIGDKAAYFQCDSAAFSPGGSGMAQTWTFTSLVVEDTFVQNIVSPSSTPNGSQFPNATFAEVGGGGEIYINNSGNDYSMVGIVEASSSLNMSYTNSMKLLTRPVNYNDMITDTFTTQYSYSGQSLTGGGVATANADAYGTLTLPDSTYNDVLRVRSEFVQNDSISGSPIPINVTVKRVSYMWFVAGFKEPVLRADSFSIQTPGPPINTYTVAYRPKDQSVGISDVELNSNNITCHLGQNSATFAGALANGKEYTIRLYDITAKLLHTASFTASSGQNTIHIPSSMVDGVYIVGIQENGRSQGYIKVVKQ